MHLNQTHKRNIVNAILADVPTTGYETLVVDYVQAEALKLMPPEIRAIYDDPSLRPFLGCASIQTHWAHFGLSRSIYWCKKSVSASTYSSTLYLTKRHWNEGLDDLSKKLVDTVYTEVVSICAKAEAQYKARESMREKLNTLLKGIRTLKQAKTLMEPELHKYLPVEPPKDAAQKDAQASVALVPYVVSSLREMGWPKDQEPKAEEVV